MIKKRNWHVRWKAKLKRMNSEVRNSRQDAGNKEECADVANPGSANAKGQERLAGGEEYETRSNWNASWSWGPSSLQEGQTR